MAVESQSLSVTSWKWRVPWVLIAASIASFTLGRYWSAEDSNYFFAALGAAVAFFAALSIEPVRHRIWVDQERWKARLHAYSTMLASLSEAEFRFSAIATNVVQDPGPTARAAAAIDQAQQQVRAAAALAAVLGDSLKQWFDEFEDSISAARQRAHQSVEAWRLEVEGLATLITQTEERAMVLKRLSDVKREVLNEQQTPESLHEYEMAVRNHGDAVREHRRLVDRRGAMVGLVPAEMRSYFEISVRAARRLRERLSEHASELQR